jgi:hypothetical protein
LNNRSSTSPSHPCSRPDLAIRREGPERPAEARLYGDSACQAYDKEHPNLDHPCKKPKDGSLSEDGKEYNKGLSGFHNPLRTHFTEASITGGIVNMESGFELC